MKKLKLLLAALLSVSPVFYIKADDEKNIPVSDIKEVVVYLNGAMISRSAKTFVDAGVTKLVFENLSSAINPQSINMSGKGDFTILSVVHQLNYLNSEKKTPEIKALEDSLEILTVNMSRLQNRKSVLNEEQSLILANKSVGGANSGINSEELESVADFLRERLTDLKEKILDESIAEKKLKEKIDKVQQQLNELNAKRSQPTSNIIVTVLAKARINAQFDFNYMVHGATWMPFYDIRSKGADQPVQLVYKANVNQNTGEDWDKVKIKLSTANPTLGGNKPELNPWYLNFIIPQVLYRKQSNGDTPAAAESRVMEIQKAETGNKPKSLAEEVNVSENALSTEFEIGIPYSVPSDGKQYALDVQNYSVAASYNYYAIPKLDKDAFLAAGITGWQEYNLLPGTANIYFEGGYVGESYINPVSTEDTLHLSLGRDKKIIITREKLKEFSSIQLLGGNRTRTLSYEITIRNTRKDSVQVNLEDQLPISQDKEIEVKMIEISGAAYNAENGKLTWNLSLAPNETLKKRLTFSVKHPKDKIVSGL